MSTITRELAKLFRKITNSEIDAEGNAHVVLSPADSLLINNARIALASLEAEPVAWAHRLINKRNGVVHPWVYGSAEACPSEGDIFNIEVMPLYTAPPAPVSVPAAMEIDDDFDSAFEHGKAVGWNAYRAAMLQSFGNSEQLNSPVIPDGWESCKHLLPIGELIHRLEEQTGEKWIYAKDAIPDGYVMVPVEPTEKMVIEGFESEPDEFFSKSEVWEAYQEMSGCQQAAHRAKLCWSAMLAAAPKPEA